MNFILYSFSMKKLVRLHIEKHKENGETYYVATSDDVQWLVVEWKTLEETIDIAYDVAQDLLKEQKSQQKKKFSEIYSYSLMIDA